MRQKSGDFCFFVYMRNHGMDHGGKGETASIPNAGIVYLQLLSQISAASTKGGGRVF